MCIRDSHICDLFAMLQQRYEDFSSEILILSFCVYSTYSFYSDLILVLTRFLFYPYCYSRCGRLSSYSLSKGGCCTRSYSSISHYPVSFLNTKLTSHHLSHSLEQKASARANMCAFQVMMNDVLLFLFFRTRASNCLEAGMPFRHTAINSS